MKMITIIRYIAGIMLVMWSVASQSMTVWVVESGQDPFSNSQATLALSTGTTSLDLYYDTEGDTSYGYDMTLDILGTGSISNITGDNLDSGNTTSTGWRQLGGDFFDGHSGSSILGFSFDFTADIGASLLISGTYTDLLFTDAAITSSTLASVAAIPVPAAFWLMLSGLGVFGFVARKNK